MSIRSLLLVLIFLVFSKQELYSQLGFSHEIGVITGPVALYSDFGERSDMETNLGNTGFGVGLVYYMNFAYRSDCNCYTRGKYYNDHFKVRIELDYHRTNLKHKGKWAASDQQGPEADFLRSMVSTTSVFEVGSQLEYYPLSIRDFSAGAYKLSPFVSAGLHWVVYDPNVTYNNELGFQSDFYNGKYNPESAISSEQGTTLAFVASVGVRYKLSPLSDLMIDSRLHSYFSNWVDGLSPNVPENKSNEWAFWLNIGYIYYFE